MARRELEGGHRAHREAEQVEGLEAERVDEVEDIIHEQVVGETVGHVVAGGAVAAGIGQVHVEGLGEVRDLGGEVLPSGRRRTVEQDERRTRAVDVVPDLEVAGPDRVHRLACHATEDTGVRPGCRPPCPAGTTRGPRGQWPGRYHRAMKERDPRGGQDTRTERDSMGEMAVPAAALYGASTQRAVLNFPISGQPMPPAFVQALALIKQAAAEANGELGLLAPDLAGAIASAAAEVAAGEHDDAFPIDIYQTGSGTSTNMNANEVIAHLAAARLGRPVHPNDDVNAGQSSNDTIPSAMQLAAALAIRTSLLPGLSRLHEALSVKALEFDPIVKTGRTHLQDATPIRLGQEFAGYAGQVEASIRRAKAALDELLSLPLGGTAVGTGINCPGRSQREDDRPAGEADRTRPARDRQPLPRPGHPRHGDRRPRGPPGDRPEPVEDRLGHPAHGHGPAGRPGRAGDPGDAARFEHHAGQGQPGDHREPDDGRRPGGRQRRHDRVQPDRQPARAERDDAGRGRRDCSNRSSCSARPPRTWPIGRSTASGRPTGAPRWSSRA